MEQLQCGKLLLTILRLFQKSYTSFTELNTNSEKISQWTYQWKMQFNPNPNKQVNEVVYFPQINFKKLITSPAEFNNDNIN